jgi:RNA polymerase sigma factor (sigma-70 family)
VLIYFSNGVYLSYFNLMQHLSNQPLSDYQLCSAIKANNELLLKKLYLDNYPKIEQLVTTNSGNEEDAQDIYQEAFLAVWRNIQLDKFVPDSENNLGGYLYQVARNKWIDQLRSRKVRSMISLDNENTIETVDEVSEEDNEQLELIKKHFNSIGDQCKSLLERFYFLKESLRKIAAHFSWTEASAKNNKYRCLQKLRSLIHQP